MTDTGWTVDTNVLSNYLRREAPSEYPRLTSWVDAVIRAGDLTISAVTLFELRRGVRAQVLEGKAKKKAARLELLLRSISVLGLDDDTFAAWNIAADLWATGRARKPAVVQDDADLLIYATARAHGRRLATVDGKLMDRRRDLGQVKEARLIDL